MNLTEAGGTVQLTENGVCWMHYVLIRPRLPIVTDSMWGSAILDLGWQLVTEFGSMGASVLRL